MKHFLFVRKTLLLSSVFSCLIICSSLSSCERGTDLPEPLPEQPQPCSNCLPDITTTGKGTFGCKVNGAIWLPKSGGGRHGISLYYFQQGLTIGGRHFSKAEAVNISLRPISDTGYYSFINFPFASSRVLFSQSGTNNEYRSQPASVGFLHLLRFDIDKGIVSGTFAFDAYNANGDTVHITDGRFDLHF